jgi:uncharacterized coiled-coil DUF342 family protein
MNWSLDKDGVVRKTGQSACFLATEAEKEFWARIKELEQEVVHWKSNHDNQVKLKAQLMDRPDLKDRAASIQKLQEEISALRKLYEEAVQCQ